jgi:hypothetical protein
MASLDIELSPEEHQLISEAIRTGNLDLFANYYMQLPNSGSMWMPDDAIGHYRSLFGYEFLFDAWSQAGQPDEFDVLTKEYQYHIRTVWDGLTPSFLYPHGYLFLPWVQPVISRDNHLALVITGTGSSKTSSVAVAALTYCVLYPGFHFLNVAPSTDQATLMIDEMEKWISGTPFAKFVKPTRGGELYLKKPYPHVAIISPLNPNIESWFVCQTVGRDADNILGKNQDWISIDEVQLMTGISEALPKLMTRMRAQRSDGTPRWSKLSMLTNPGDNPELDEIRKRITAIQANPEATIKALFIEGVDSSANVYNTKKQRDFHRSLMDVQDEERWLGGKQTGVVTNRMIPEVLLTRCYDEELNIKLREDDANPYNATKREGIGLIHYQMPYEDGHFYIVSGDPGQANPVKRSLNNIPVVTVFDITSFLARPSRLVYFQMIDGNGSYTPWLDMFRACMMHYRAQGYYDATNINTAFEDAGIFAGFVTVTGRIVWRCKAGINGGPPT